jgi:hypothetical protein
MLAGRLSYANVVATIALFVALGGSSYAAVTITGRNVKNGSLTGKDVKDRSLRPRDFAAGRLPRGRQGVQGPKGEQGDTGAQGTPGPVIAESTSADLDLPLVGVHEVASVTVAPTTPAHIMAMASVDAIGDGADDDELSCFLNDGAGAAVDDLGLRQSVGLAAVEGGGDDNEDVLTLVAGEDRPAGGRTIKVFCSANGTVTIDTVNLVVWAGDA